MKKTGKKTKPEIKPAGRFCERVPADHPIYQTGYVVGGRYPAHKPTQLDKIADKLATERNAASADEDIRRDAVFQAAADRARAETPAAAGLAAQLSATIDQMMAEANSEATGGIRSRTSC
jgi:hypothetical protein